jgi:hypothetical protein
MQTECSSDDVRESVSVVQFRQKGFNGYRLPERTFLYAGRPSMRDDVDDRQVDK